MGRLYTVPFSAVAVSAANVDLFEITIPAQASGGKPIIVRNAIIGQSTDYGDTQAEGLSIALKRGSGTITVGSGGSAATPVAKDSTEVAAQFTAKTCNTTGASAGSGTITTLVADAFNIQSGWAFQPLPSEAPQFNPGQYAIVSIVGTPSDSLTISGTMLIEELN